MNTFNLDLDLDKNARGYPNPVVRIRKGDKAGTTIVATLYDHGTRLTTSGLAASMEMLLPDGTHYYRAQGTYNAGVVTVQLDESHAASVTGDTSIAYLRLYQGESVIASTEPFAIRILRSAVDEGEDPAESYDDIIPVIVRAWLVDHPEATTTVQDGAVTTPKLADDAVTTPKLADNAVTDAKLAPQASYLMTYANDRVVDSNVLRPNSHTGQTVTTTKENKAMSLDGTESSSNAFFLYTFTAEADKVYRITPFGVGGEYAQHAAVKLVKGSTTVGLYYFQDNALDNTRYLVNFAGTVKVCVRSTITTFFACYDNTAIRADDGIWSTMLGNEDTSWLDPDEIQEHKFFRRDQKQIVETSTNLCVYEAELDAYDFIDIPPFVTNYTLNSPLSFWDDETGAYVPYDPAWEAFHADYFAHHYFIAPKSGKALFSLEPDCLAGVRIYRDGPIGGYLEDSATQSNVDQMSLDPSAGQIMYNLDTPTQTDENRVVNAVMYADGTIIAARSNGTVVRIGYDGTEEVVLAITGTFTDWRGLFIDSNESVYASPHASLGSMTMTDRGLYKLEKGAEEFTKVISLYDPSSQTQSETVQNDDTIWTMCEDREGNLYAGTYAHTVRTNAVVYKSTDGGDTWAIVYNFLTSGVLDGSPGASNAKHVHSIVYSRWQDALYAIVGEVNTVLKSTDGGVTWTNLGVVSPWEKGSAMLPTKDGIIIGSDGAYACVLFMLLNDDKTLQMLYKGWASTVFAIRKSDVSGIIYAFTKIDSSVTGASYYPPDSVTSTSDPDFTTWYNSTTTYYQQQWTAYHNATKDRWPEDAMKPRHYAILASRDGGRTWGVLYRSKKYDATKAYGCWTTGYFFNGECLTGQFGESSHGDFMVSKPIVISEGRHRYTSGGADLSGEVLAKAGASTTVTPIRNYE